MTATEETTPETGMVTREEFGAQQLQVPGDTAASAVGAHARAAVETRSIMAERNPRNWDTVRLELLRDCQRPSFAKSARYYLPVGKGIEGPTIRFAEACLTAMRNTYTQTAAIFDDDTRRILQVSVFDLERNTSFSKDVTIRKEVERKKLKKGQEAISQRVNSYGERVFLVRATDDEVFARENALVSKTMRTQALRLVPGWLQDEAMELVKKTRADEAAKDPDAERRSLADGFAELNVMPVQLEDFMGCDLGSCSPAQLVRLRGLWSALKSGETTWAEIMESKGGSAEEAQEKPNGTRTEQLRKRLEEAAAAASAVAAAAAQTEDPTHEPDERDVLRDMELDSPEARQKRNEEIAADETAPVTVVTFKWLQQTVKEAKTLRDIQEALDLANKMHQKRTLSAGDNAQLLQDAEDRSKALAKGRGKKR